jgi:hypothetical protein
MYILTNFWIPGPARSLSSGRPNWARPVVAVPERRKRYAFDIHLISGMAGSTQPMPARK